MFVCFLHLHQRGLISDRYKEDFLSSIHEFFLLVQESSYYNQGCGSGEKVPTVAKC